MAYTVIKNQSGKRIFTGNPDAGVKMSSRQIARTIGIGETSVREVLSGKIRRGWEKTEYQRLRDNMRISYKLTEEGRRARDRGYGFFNAFLRACEAGEASDVSEKLLAQGYEQADRKRVLIEASRAVKRGLIIVDKESGAIFGR